MGRWHAMGKQRRGDELRDLQGRRKRWKSLWDNGHRGGGGDGGQLFDNPEEAQGLHERQTCRA